MEYQEPVFVSGPEDCTFYHAMNLPPLGSVAGLWDLRPTVDEYLARFDFAGRSVLDIGTASGYLSFEAERRGASSVVSVDLADPAQREMVPYAGFDAETARHAHSQAIRRIQRSYWLAHRLLGSQARLLYGSAYDLPEALGCFDVVLLGMILPHLRDPFRALERAARHASEWMIITQQSMRGWWPVMRFQPDPERGGDAFTWWLLSEAAIERMLAVLGFELVRKLRARHHCVARGRRETCTAFLARRAR